jgi:hypothetical protein
MKLIRTDSDRKALMRLDDLRRGNMKIVAIDDALRSGLPGISHLRNKVPDMHNIIMIDFQTKLLAIFGTTFNDAQIEMLKNEFRVNELWYNLNPADLQLIIRRIAGSDLMHKQVPFHIIFKAINDYCEERYARAGQIAAEKHRVKKLDTKSEIIEKKRIEEIYEKMKAGTYQAPPRAKTVKEREIDKMREAMKAYMDEKKGR